MQLLAKIRAAGNCGRAGSARRRGIVKGDKLSPLTNVLIRYYWNLGETREIAVRYSRNIKNSEKSKSKKNTKIIRTTQPPANSTQADSEAILPNPMQMVSLGATSLRENGLLYPAKGGSTPAFACQRAAIAPLLCLNLQSYFSLVSDCEFLSFQKCNCSRKNRLQN